MSITTYSDFQAQSVSEKIGLVKIEASMRLPVWTLYSGSIYSTTFSYPVIVSLTEEGVELTESASIAGTTAGKYYYDRLNSTLYLRTTESVDPSTKFIGVTFELYFSNVNIKAPHDLSTGFDVDWLPLFSTDSEFKREIDNANQFGNAIEGTGSIKLFNDQNFWGPIYDKLVFEGQKVYVYSWTRVLPISEAATLFIGRIEKKSYSDSGVSFNVKDLLKVLRDPIDLAYISEVTYTPAFYAAPISARVPTNLENAFQRSIYGYVSGFRPTNIDQVLDGYPIRGQAVLVNGDATCTESVTTLWSNYVTPGDKVRFGTDTAEYTIDSITSATVFELSEPYEGTSGTKTVYLKPSEHGRWCNRVFQLSGHTLCQFATTVSEIFIAGLRFRVADASGFVVGDSIEINGEAQIIFSITDETIIQTVVTFDTSFSVSDACVKSSIKNVYLNKELLVGFDDYTYSPDTGQLTLNSGSQTNPEFNHAPIQTLGGTLSYNTASRTVTGTSTLFTKFLRENDYILPPGSSNWLQIWSISTDTSLLVRSLPDVTTAAGTTLFKKVDFYQEGQSVISCDIVGKTVDGTKQDVPLYRGPEIAYQLLVDVGLTAQLNATSFQDASNDSNHVIGLVIPETFNAKKAPATRDVLNKINRSIFGLLYQDGDFLFSYSIIQPNKQINLLELNEVDVLGFRVSSSATKTYGSVEVSYLNKEYDPISNGKAESIYTGISKTAQYLASNENKYTLETYLKDEGSARIFTSRLLFLFELSTGNLTIETKMQGALININDAVKLDHEKLYERVGSSIKQKIGLVRDITKTVTGVKVEIDDLGNAFSRCATIAANTTSDFADASDNEKILNGFITESNGTIESIEDFGSNLIW